MAWLMEGQLTREVWTPELQGAAQLAPGKEVVRGQEAGNPPWRRAEAGSGRRLRQEVASLQGLVLKDPAALLCIQALRKRN